VWWHADLGMLFYLQLLYKSTGFIDELAWAAAWLYKATGTASYLADAKKYYSQVCICRLKLCCSCRSWKHNVAFVEPGCVKLIECEQPSAAQIALPGYSFETGEKGPGLNVLMGDIDPDNAGDYQSNAKQYFDQYLGQTIPCVTQLLPCRPSARLRRCPWVRDIIYLISTHACCAGTRRAAWPTHTTGELCGQQLRRVLYAS
jgi:Glycosyl hydrolase family 9